MEGVDLDNVQVSEFLEKLDLIPEDGIGLPVLVIEAFMGDPNDLEDNLASIGQLRQPGLNGSISVQFLEGVNEIIRPKLDTFSDARH